MSKKSFYSPIYEIQPFFKAIRAIISINAHENMPIFPKQKNDTISFKQMQTALKPSWNPADVEPGNQEGPDCWDLGRVLVLIQNTRFVWINGTNQTKERYRGRKPASKKLLMRCTQTMHLNADVHKLCNQ